MRAFLFSLISLLYSSSLLAEVTIIDRPDASLLGARISVFSGGPDLQLRATEGQRFVSLKMPDVTVQGKGSLLTSPYSVGNDPEKLEVVLDSPFIATINGVDYFVVPALIYGFSSYENRTGWFSAMPTVGQITGQFLYSTGWLLVDASSGAISPMPLVHHLHAWRLLKPKDESSPGTAVIHSQEETSAILASMRNAEEQRKEQAALERARAQELRQVKETGAAVCFPEAKEWKQRGYTEGLSENGERIQIRVSDGERAGQIIWDEANNWRICESASP